MTTSDPLASGVRVEATPEESAAGAGSGLFSSLTVKLADWRRSAMQGYDAASHTGRQLRVLAVIAFLTAFVALALWGAYAVFDLLSRESAPEAPPAAAVEVEDPSGPAELAKAQREAQRALEQAERERQLKLEEAERERQLNAARMQADQYQWETWQQTVRATEENRKRLAEKQRIADEKAAEEARQAWLEEQKLLEERRRVIAAQAPEARAAARAKKRMKTFE